MSDKTNWNRSKLMWNGILLFEIWFDGANGGSGYYGCANETRTIDHTTYYECSNTYKLIRKLQPNIVKYFYQTRMVLPLFARLDVF